MSALSRLINKSFAFVVNTSNLYKIDESHAVKHSMDVFHYARDILQHERINDPTQEKIIYSAAILHDMCDKKYMDEAVGLKAVEEAMRDHLTNEELKAMISIITTMSYSKVKVNGYPELGKYQTAYHIVREADLLAAYDIDRCIMFGMFNDGVEYSDALVRAKDIFTTRVLTYRSDNLFVTDRSKQLSESLHQRAYDRMKTL
jgi:HD superfamily phosphodiesterase